MTFDEFREHRARRRADQSHHPAGRSGAARPLSRGARIERDHRAGLQHLRRTDDGLTIDETRVPGSAPAPCRDRRADLVPARPPSGRSVLRAAIARRTWTTGNPTVAIDDAHWNQYTAISGYAPFARLLFAKGISSSTGAMSRLPRSSSGRKSWSLPNALGLRGVIRQVGQVANIRLDAIAADAFTDQEVNQLETWVREGGSLLLIADHAPAGRAAQSVADRFGVTMRDGYVFDPERSEPWSPTFLIFTRQSKTLGLHPITEGPSQAESVNRIVTFSGQALEGPPQATQLLTLSQTAFESSGRTASLEDRKPVGGLAQALGLPARQRPSRRRGRRRGVDLADDVGRRGETAHRPAVAQQRQRALCAEHHALVVTRGRITEL